MRETVRSTPWSRMAAAILLSTLCLSAAACSESVIERKLVDRRPAAHLMIPCPREPEPPPVGSGQKIRARYGDALIEWGLSCMRTADGLQEHHNTPAPRD